MKKVLMLLTILTLNLSFAQNIKSTQSEKREPSEEAIISCEGEIEGTTCYLESPLGETVEGLCRTTPDYKYFVCVPNKNQTAQGE